MFNWSNNLDARRWMISGCLVLFCLGLIACSAKDPEISKEEEKITRQHKQEYEAGMEAGD